MGICGGAEDDIKEEFKMGTRIYPKHADSDEDDPVLYKKRIIAKMTTIKR